MSPEELREMLVGMTEHLGTALDQLVRVGHNREILKAILEDETDSVIDVLDNLNMKLELVAPANAIAMEAVNKLIVFAGSLEQADAVDPALIEEFT